VPYGAQAVSVGAGINFVGLGLPGGREGSATSAPHGSRVRVPKPMSSPRRWLRYTRKDIAMAAHVYSDPLPYLLERAGVLG